MDDVLLLPNLTLSIYYWIDVVLFFVFAITVLYLLLYASVSRLNDMPPYPSATKSNRIAVVYLSFDTNWNIKECLDSYFNQDYPFDKYKIFVVGPSISQDRQDIFRMMNVDYIVCDNATLRRTLLSVFISELENKEQFDFVAIHRVYDRVESDFLSKVNDALYSGCDVVQTHCMTVNDESNWNVYKTISAEINNSIFRRAHCRLSLSSALSNTGMIMSVNILKMCLKKKLTVGIEKQFEQVILQNNYYIEYLDNVYTYDCKKEAAKDVYVKQKKLYWYYIKNMIRTIFYLPVGIIKGNIDYINKLLQWILPPRLVLIIIIAILGCFTTFVDVFTSLKWWALLFLLVITFYLAIPSSLIKGKLGRVLLLMPIYLLFGIKFNKDRE